MLSKRPVTPENEKNIEFDEDEMAWAEGHIYDGADEMFRSATRILRIPYN